MGDFYSSENKQHITACKQHCLAAGAKQGNIAYTQNVMGKIPHSNRPSVCLSPFTLTFRISFVCDFLKMMELRLTMDLIH